MAWSGLVAGVPAVVALPLGVWLAGRTGYASVICITAAAALAPLAAMPRIPGKTGHPEAATGVAGDAGTGAGQPAGPLAGLRRGGQLRPSAVFAATQCQRRGCRLPPARRVSGDVAACGLFVQAVTATISRWWARAPGRSVSCADPSKEDPYG